MSFQEFWVAEIWRTGIFILWAHIELVKPVTLENHLGNGKERRRKGAIKKTQANSSGRARRDRNGKRHRDLEEAG